jgi:ferredoxin-NADP reductase
MIETGDASPVSVQWQKARVVSIERSTLRIKNFSLALEHPFQFSPGQHVDVKLTAEDGYIALRSYSIASPPGDTGHIELAIERLDEGEVSTFFHDVIVVGDEVEIRGPLGGHFILRPEDQGPILLIGGGSGVVPLVSMVRSQRNRLKPVPMALLVSARTWDDILFRDELLGLESPVTNLYVTFTLTRDKPQRPTDYGRRIDASMVEDSLRRLPSEPLRTYICGSNPFVNTAADNAIASGISTQLIRTERYGG